MVFVIVLAQYFLQPGMALLAGVVSGVPLLPRLLYPDRWLLWMGVSFVVVVYFFRPGSWGGCGRGI